MHHSFSGEKAARVGHVFGNSRLDARRFRQALKMAYVDIILIATFGLRGQQRR